MGRKAVRFCLKVFASICPPATQHRLCFHSSARCSDAGHRGQTNMPAFYLPCHHRIARAAGGLEVVGSSSKKLHLC